MPPQTTIKHWSKRDKEAEQPQTPLPHLGHPGPVALGTQPGRTEADPGQWAVSPPEPAASGKRYGLARGETEGRDALGPRLLWSLGRGLGGGCWEAGQARGVGDNEKRVLIVRAPGTSESNVLASLALFQQQEIIF